MTDNELNKVLGLRGWCDREKARTLHAQLGRLSAALGRPIAGAEIGVFGGRSLFAAALGLRDSAHGGVIVGIDPYTDDAATESVTDPKDAHYWRHEIDYPDVLRECQACRVSLQLTDYCALLLAPSQLAASVVGALDYLHIDGNHSPTVALRDAQLYLPKVRTGGLVVVDDCDWDGVRAAWDYVAECGRLIHRTKRDGHPDACDYAIYEMED